MRFDASYTFQANVLPFFQQAESDRSSGASSPATRAQLAESPPRANTPSPRRTPLPQRNHEHLNGSSEFVLMISYYYNSEDPRCDMKNLRVVDPDYPVDHLADDTFRLIA